MEARETYLQKARDLVVINFQELCDFTIDKSVFRDPPDAECMLHFRFDTMDAVNRRIVEALQPMT